MQPSRRARYNVTRLLEDMAIKGWTSAQLARASGCHPNTISSFLHGTIQSPKTAAKIAHALGYTPKRYYSHLATEEPIAS